MYGSERQGTNDGSRWIAFVDLKGSYSTRPQHKYKHMIERLRTQQWPYDVASTIDPVSYTS